MDAVVVAEAGLDDQVQSTNENIKDEAQSASVESENRFQKAIAAWRSRSNELCWEVQMI